MTEIKTIKKSNCYVCGSEGETIYEGLVDKLFVISGKWDISKCKNEKCKLIWLNPMPIEEDIHIAYNNYYTHSSGEIAVAKNSFYDDAQNEYLSSKFGYGNIKKSIKRNFLYLDPSKLEEAKFKVMYLKEYERPVVGLGLRQWKFPRIYE